MVVIFSTSITQDSINFLQMISDLETSFISVERCANFEQIKPEPNYLTFNKEENKMVNLPTKAELLKPHLFAPP